jgi:hypothetical protein
MKKIATLHNNFFEKITNLLQKFNLIVSEEKSGGSHLKKFVMTLLRKNQ